MGKYEDAISAGLTDSDIISNFADKAKQSIDAVGPEETSKFLKTNLELPDHVVSALVGGKQVQTSSPTTIQGQQDIRPASEAPAAPVIPTSETPEPSMLEKISNIGTGIVKEVKQVAGGLGIGDSAEQGIGAIAGTAGQIVGAGEKATNYLIGKDLNTPIADPLSKFSEDMDTKWKEKYGDSFNIQKLIADVATPMGPAFTAMKDAKSTFGVLKNLLNPQNATSVLTGMVVTDAQLRRDKVENPEAWALAFGSLQAVLPTGIAMINSRTSNLTEQYINKTLGISKDDIANELKVIEQYKDLSNLTDIEKSVLVASKINPQAAVGLQKVMLSDDQYASHIFAELQRKTEQVNNITAAKSEDIITAMTDTSAQIKGQYGQMSNMISDATGDMAFDISKVKTSLVDNANAIGENLVGRDKSLATLGKINRSEPTTYDDLAELTSDVGKRVRALPQGDTTRLMLEDTYRQLRNSIQENVTNFSSVEGKQVIKASIDGQNEAYSFLKGQLEESGIYKSTILKNVPKDKGIQAIVNSVTSNTSPELTGQFIKVLDRVKQTTNPELVDQSILNNVIEYSTRKVSESGTKLVDFAKLSETLDKIPEGIITSPQAKLVAESLQDIASFSKYDIPQAKAISRFGGKEAGELSSEVGSTLGFNLKLKASQFIAKAGLRLVNDSSAYAVTVSKLLDKKKELPIVIGQFKNAFGYNLPRDDLSQMDKYLKQTSDLYNESTQVHNFQVSEPALTNNEGTYWRQLSNLYDEGTLKDMFNVKNSSIGTDMLPYAKINNDISFRWDKVGDKPSDIKAISTKLDELIPGQKIVRGKETDFSGDIWTISKKDQFTPGALSEQVLNQLDGKVQGIKYNLSREVPDIMGQGDMKILSNDLEYHLASNGVDTSKFGKSNMHFGIGDDGILDNIFWQTKNGSVNLDRTINVDGTFTWSANTVGFNEASGEGGKWYQGVFDWINSMGPKHSYDASTALSDINQYRSSINQLKAELRTGRSSFINPSDTQVGANNLGTTGNNFNDLSVGVVNYLNKLIDNTSGFTGVKVSELSDKQIKDLVNSWHPENGLVNKLEGTKAENIREIVQNEHRTSTGETTLKMMRAIAKRIENGTLTQEQAKNLSVNAEKIADSLPKPIVGE